VILINLKGKRKECKKTEKKSLSHNTIIHFIVPEISHLISNSLTRLEIFNILMNKLLNSTQYSASYKYHCSKS
jgi:hypothetical protein